MASSITGKALAGTVTAGIGFAIKNAQHLSQVWEIVNKDGRASAQARKLADSVRGFVAEKDPALRLRRQVEAIEASLAGENEASPTQLDQWRSRLANIRRRIELTQAESPSQRRSHLKRPDAAVATIFTEIVETTVRREVGEPSPRRRLPFKR